MKRRSRKKYPVVDRTYRLAPGPVNYDEIAEFMIGNRVVVYMPKYNGWKSGYLISVHPQYDSFRILWRRSAEHSKPVEGIWRVHYPSLFTGTYLLPIPAEPARLPQSTPDPRRVNRMATSSKGAAKKAASKKVAAKKVATKPAAESNGGRARGQDKLTGLSDARRRNIAKLIYRERSKSPSTSWPDITQMIEDKYDWTLPGSMTGRRLLREYGPEGAEGAIIQQDRSAPKAAAKKSAAKKGSAKKSASKRKAVVEEPEDEEELEDEELEDEEDEDLEDEDEEEMEEDLDEEDEDEEDEEEEPTPAPRRRAAKKVTVTRGRGKKANPS